MAFPVPHQSSNVFMLLVLDRAKMQGVSGLAKCRDEFLTVS